MVNNLIITNLTNLLMIYSQAQKFRLKLAIIVVAGIN